MAIDALVGTGIGDLLGIGGAAAGAGAADAGAAAGIGDIVGTGAGLAGGTTGLEGTLAAQLAPPAPPPNAFGGPDAPVHNRGDSGPAAQSQEVPQKEVGQVKEGPSGGAPSGERQGGASSAALKRAEAGAFKRFVAKGGRREFEFVYHDEAEQAILKAGLADQGPKSRVLHYD